MEIKKAIGNHKVLKGSSINRKLHQRLKSTSKTVNQNSKEVSQQKNQDLNQANQWVHITNMTAETKEVAPLNVNCTINHKETISPLLSTHHLSKSSFKQQVWLNQTELALQQRAALKWHQARKGIKLILHQLSTLIMDVKEKTAQVLDTPAKLMDREKHNHRIQEIGASTEAIETTRVKKDQLNRFRKLRLHQHKWVRQDRHQDTLFLIHNQGQILQVICRNSSIIIIMTLRREMIQVTEQIIWVNTKTTQKSSVKDTEIPKTAHMAASILNQVIKPNRRFQKLKTITTPKEVATQKSPRP